MDATLALPTGRLIIGDPGELFGDAKPLDLDLPPGDCPVSAGPEGIEVRLREAHVGVDVDVDVEPVRWTVVLPGFDTPSGLVCLLDASALEQFTELGDEPVDEYELLAERVLDSPGRPVDFAGLLVLPAGRSVQAVRAGYDAADRLTRLVADIR